MRGNIAMKKQFWVASALLALTAVHAQVSGPNRPGPGTSPGTFQNPDAPQNLPASNTPSLNQSTNQPGQVRGDDYTPSGSVVDPTFREWQEKLYPPDRRVNTNSNPFAPPPEVQAIPSDLNATGINTPASRPEGPLDQALSAKIRAQLSQQPTNSTDSLKIAPATVRDLRITSQSGKVILEGTVENWEQKGMIEKQAKAIPGVASVDNRIRIGRSEVGGPPTSLSGQAAQTNSSPAKPPNLRLGPTPSSPAIPPARTTK